MINTNINFTIKAFIITFLLTSCLTLTKKKKTVKPIKHQPCMLAKRVVINKEHHHSTLKDNSSSDDENKDKNNVKSNFSDKSEDNSNDIKGSSKGTSTLQTKMKTKSRDEGQTYLLSDSNNLRTRLPRGQVFLQQTNRRLLNKDELELEKSEEEEKESDDDDEKDNEEGTTDNAPENFNLFDSLSPNGFM